MLTVLPRVILATLGNLALRTSETMPMMAAFQHC